MCALVTINNISNCNNGGKVLVNPHTVAFVGAEVYATLVYIFRCH